MHARRSTRRAARAGLLAGAMLLGSLGPAGARADGATVLVIALGRPGLQARLGAELRNLGLSPVEAALTPRDPLALEAAAAMREAAAAIWIPAGTSAAHIWIADRVTGKLVMREVPGGDEALLALAATELLRASLLELAVGAPHGRVEAPARLGHEVARAARRARGAAGPWIALEVGVAAHVGAIDPAMTVGVASGGRWGALELGGRLEGREAAFVEGRGAQARLRLGRLGTRGALVGTLAPPLALVAALELDLVLAAARGVEAPGVSVRTDWALGLSAGAALGLRLSLGAVQVEVAGTIGALLPPTEILFAGARVAWAGAPMLGARAGLVVPLE